MNDSASVPNNVWQQMEGQRFQLCDCVNVNSLEYSGSRSYLLQNAFSRRQLRLSQGIFQLLENMDGRRTLGQICALFTVDEALTANRQQEVVSAITQLQTAGMITSEQPRDVVALVEQQQRDRQNKKTAQCMRLLSPKFALLDPDTFLTRSYPWLAWLFKPLFLFVILCISAVAGSLALMHWQALATYGAQRFDDPAQWILLICTYPLIKAMHELGHCYVAKSGGAAVNELGITLLVFLPVPYVDASAASLFADKYRRMLVGSAGIIVEVFLASIAFFFWLQSDEGMPRDIAFTIMLIGGVSTLLFNGNPLLRFDGYYVLADAIEIPNLSSRCSRYYEYLFRRYILRVQTNLKPLPTRREKRWFVAYGAAAWLYRIGVSVAIAIFLIINVPALGVLMATWLLTVQFLLPIFKQLHFLIFSPALVGRRIRAAGFLSGGIAAIVGFLTLVSLPNSTVAEGVVMLPEQAVVRAHVDGFLDSRSLDDQKDVEPGDVLFVLKNTSLTTDMTVLKARVLELQTRRDLLSFDERVARDIHTKRLNEAKEELKQLQKREANLKVRSPSKGRLQLAIANDHAGRLIKQGDMLAYLRDQSDIVIRIVASQKHAKLIREGANNIEVRLASQSAVTVAGKLLGEVPLAAEQLPSAALGSKAGGNIQVDARDARGTTALERVFAFDVSIPSSEHGHFVGGRASVRFEHAASALLPRWYDALHNTISKKIYSL